MNLFFRCTPEEKDILRRSLSIFIDENEGVVPPSEIEIAENLLSALGE